MDLGPARQPHSPLVFRVGAEPHFPRLEQFPIKGLQRSEKADELEQIEKTTKKVDFKE